MQNLDKERIRTIIVNEDHITPERADLLLKNFPPVNDALADAVEQWLENRTVANVAVEGLSIETVMRLRQCHFLIAVKDLSRLTDPSLSTEMRDRLHEILSKPVIIE